jgi:hypothetical protein
MKVQQISVTAIHDDIEGALNARPLLTCSFCGKSTTMHSIYRQVCEKLSPRDAIFCRFCIRNGLTYKNNRHTLILSFRSIIGYLYYHDYKVKKKTIYFNQLLDMLNSHETVGLVNPAFKYDPETFFWFVDFEKVGATGRKIPIEEIHKTVFNILSCFNLYATVPGIRMHKFADRYREAITTLYQKRSRPEGKKILSPTFQGCGVFDTKDLPLEKTREFSPRKMIP